MELPAKEDLLQNRYKRTRLIGSRALRRIETLYKIITSWGQEIFWVWYRKMLSCREDLTAATWPEQLGKRTVAGFSSSLTGGRQGTWRTELVLCLAAGLMNITTECECSWRLRHPETQQLRELLHELTWVRGDYERSFLVVCWKCAWIQYVCFRR